ncbi:flavodoxin domain-containing protein [Mesobacillus maritimus]|uniref:flavodoxin domain-containing protein n=1 Tax=Mesobacillus maritimus TaxID=1643336 RepID=UPI00384E0581
MKTLIIYATKYGSVEHVAVILGRKIEGDVCSVNISTGKVPSLEDYHAIILGGSIYAGKIQKELKVFIEENLPVLLQKRVGLFLCAAHPDPEIREKELKENFPSELYYHAIAKETVGYEIHYQKMNLVERLLARMIMKVKTDQTALASEQIDKFADDMNDSLIH